MNKEHVAWKKIVTHLTVNRRRGETEASLLTQVGHAPFHLAKYFPSSLMASDKEDELVVQLTVQLLISQVAYREAAQPERNEYKIYDLVLALQCKHSTGMM